MQECETKNPVYRGEPIDIQGVLGRIAFAAKPPWIQDNVSVSDERLPQRTTAMAYRRTSRFPHKRIYLSTGIHGDEPAGPLAIAQLMESGIFPDHAEVWVCPCLNQTAFYRNSRANDRGVDLDTDYRKLETEEVRTHVSWLKRKPNFDLTLCLHEDHTTKGFYIWESNPDDIASPAKKIISRVAGVCPIDRSDVIHDMPADNGVVRANGNPYANFEWNEAVFLATHKTKLSYTLKAPSQLPLVVRAAALAGAVQAVLDWIKEQG
ncbi:MAG: M14 family metallopeptidase [Limisphaerales bacterium]